MTAAPANGLRTVKLSEIEPWPGLNPRRAFDDEQLTELAQSIQKDGLLQPVAAAPAGEAVKNGTRLWLFAGERRLRASQLIGAETIDVLVRDVDEATAHRLAGLENIDRSDLTAIEEAKWLERELELTGLSQKDLAEEIDRSQGWIANRIRLLALPEDLQELVQDGVLAPATARDVLLRFLKLDEDLQTNVFRAVTKRLKDNADGDSLPTRDVKIAVARALDGSKACTTIGHGHYHHQKGNVWHPVRITPAKLKRFKKEHAGRCIKAASGWDGSTESWWTWEKKAWETLLQEECEKQRERKEKQAAEAGPDPELVANPGLGPGHETLERSELRERFGWQNFTELDEIADPSGIEPSHVVRASFQEWDDEEWATKEALFYVGPDAEDLGRSQHELIEEEARRGVAKLYRGALDRAGSMDVVEVLRGLLELALRTPLHHDVIAILEEAGIELPVGLQQYADRPQLQDLELDTDIAWTLAGAVSTLPTMDGSSWDRKRKAREQAKEKLEPRWTKAWEAWLAENWEEGV